MKLTIATSGGFANIRLSGEIETEELDADLARKTAAALRPERLDGLQLLGGPSVADAMQFELTLLSGDEAHRYTLDEARVPADVSEVLHALVREIVRRKRRG